MKDEQVAKDLRKYIQATLVREFGYCGVCDGDRFLMLNSGEGNIKVQITWEDEADND